MTLAPARRFPLLVLAYLGPLAVIPLFLSWGARGDADVQWHARHGLLLVVLEAAVLGALAAVASITALSNLGGGIALGVLTWIGWLAALALQLAAILAAANGRRLQVPYVTGMVDKVREVLKF